MKEIGVHGEIGKSIKLLIKKDEIIKLSKATFYDRKQFSKKETWWNLVKKKKETACKCEPMI